LDHSEEVKELIAELRRLLPSRISGKDAVLDMKNGGSRNWRQMEWIGFWFEYFVETKVEGLSQFRRGPKYGNVTFDLARNFVWDLKSHPEQAGNKLPLNDQEAVRIAAASGGLGYLIIIGDAEYDDTGEFKSWHDELKGKKTAYVLSNEAKGKPSRRRKSEFRPFQLLAIWLEDEAAIDRGISEGWLGSFQEGMANANGVPRRAKFMLTLDKLPQDIILAFTAL
jgi:hypothetical protein